MHGNDQRNTNPHPLYDIFRNSNRDTFKYGIADDPIDTDGLSARARDQLEALNLAAEFQKFGAEILVTDIPGRTEALLVERQFIDAYYEKNGSNPIGNKFPLRKG